MFSGLSYRQSGRLIEKQRTKPGMDSERWRRIEELYHAAVATPPESLQTFLDSACGADAELRREVESLVARDGQAGSFLESRATETLTLDPAAAMLGRQVGPYRIVAPLGAGGMGEVYRARDSKLQRDVALKTLPAAFANDPDLLARFRRGARTLASLNHPNIGAIYGLEESEGATCLVLELVEGETIRGPLPVPKALDYARQIAEATEAAHAKGIIHRDLKPGNVKVTPQGRVKVLDFGLAKAIQGGEEQADLSQTATIEHGETRLGQIVGTPAYMSPEQARGGTVDQRTDVWAFGCVLYELLTGKRTFRGDTLQETLKAVLEREPDWIPLPAKTPARVRELLQRCLQKDAARRVQDIADVRRTLEQAQGKKNHWRLAAIATAAVLIVGAMLWVRQPAPPADVSQWVRLTNFPDSVSQPALSPDGRMLTFIRGSDTFMAPGQIYVKMLPDGDPVQLTNDDLIKMSPVFSPDGTRIAYSVDLPRYRWDTWVVPLLGPVARPWLVNASGLVWIGKDRVLFSEIKNKGIHMGIDVASENREGQHRVYLPKSELGMAHRSYLSPDGKYVLVVEMDLGVWLPCRLVPLDGSSPGRTVGPSGGRCTFAAWSPDGKWMYFSSSAGGTFHTWRQRYPDGRPDQITAGVTEEEGIAMASDGRSFVTAVALKQSTVWINEKGKERQISIEGYSYDPAFTPDGKKLMYRILKGAAPSDPGELRIVDLESGRNEALLPGLLVSGSPAKAYNISPDGRRVVARVIDSEGREQFWIAPIDRQSPPRLVPDITGVTPRFLKDGEILFGGLGKGPSRVREDGTGLQVLGLPPAQQQGLSPDRRWLAFWRGRDGVLTGVSLDGAPPKRIIASLSSDGGRVLWSADQTRIFISVPSNISGGLSGRTYSIPLPPGEVWPRTPPGGYKSIEELAKRVPGVEVMDKFDVSPGPTPYIYAFSRSSVQRNLYRVPVP
jgi:eukaryotic-like serine/threonine-protein kinase